MSTLKITGMTCDSCAVHVKDALEKVPGVQSADVSYAKGSAKLAIEVGTSPDALTAAVAGLGYRATLADAPSVSTPGGLLDKMRDLLGRNDKTGSSGALHIAVIGSGGAAMAAALKAVEQGARVTLIERGTIGGTCVNAGCVPKKIMWYAAHLAHAVDDASGFGIPAERGQTDWGKLVRGRQDYIERIHRYWDGYVVEQGIKRIDGQARFVDSHSVEVDGQQFSAKHIVIATGGRPIVPKLPGAELGFTSDGFFALHEQPHNVAIIGAGYIGVELAGVLRALGSQVTLLGSGPRILKNFDEMLSTVLTGEVRKQGIELKTCFRAAGLVRTDAGIALDASDGQRLDGFDQVIWAVGRAPNTAELGLDEMCASSWNWVSRRKNT